MDTLPAVLRGTLLVLSHTMSLYVMADASERVKHSGLYWTVVSLIIEAVVASLFYVKNFTFYSGGIAFVILGVSYFAAFIYWADGAVVRNIFLYILYITFFMLAASISNLIGKMFFNEDGLAIAYIRSLFSIALIIIYPWKIKKPFQKATDDIGKGWSVLIVFEIVAFLTISVLAFIGAFYLEDNSVYLLLLLMVSFLLLSSNRSFNRSFLLLPPFNPSSILSLPSPPSHSPSLFRIASSTTSITSSNTELNRIPVDSKNAIACTTSGSFALLSSSISRNIPTNYPVSTFPTRVVRGFADFGELQERLEQLRAD